MKGLDFAIQKLFAFVSASEPSTDPSVINWNDFPLVAGLSIGISLCVVAAFAVGIRLLASAGYALTVEPKEFTDQIAVLDEEELKAAKKARKKLRKQLTPDERKLYVVGAICCFAIAIGIIVVGLLELVSPEKIGFIIAAAVIVSIVLLIPDHLISK